MPTPEAELAIAEEKFRQFLVLADEILALRRTASDRLGAALQAGMFQGSIRNSVLVGLSIKALGSFDRLFVDARDRRAECSHHLKTMAECFIYSGWVGGDTGDTRAKVLCADGFCSRAVYHKAIGETELAAEYERMRRQEIEGLETAWKTFRETRLERLSEAANRNEHYRHVYKMACEAAHLGDLTVYMPPQPTEIGFRLSDISFLRAYVCLKFGVILACDILHDASDALGIGMDQQINGIRDRWKAIVAIVASVADSQGEGRP